MMLKKLRLKFILINMTIVTVMLCAIFGLLYSSTERNLERESLRMMETIAVDPVKPGPPDRPRDNVYLPYFRVRIDRQGKVIETDGGFFDLSDREQLDAILSEAVETNEKSGILKEYRLRFLRTESPMGQCLVFADMSSEQSTLHHLIRTFSIVGGAAFLLFLGISILLARWAVKPVATAWQQQKQFVADASHELKTPLTVIMTDAELLHAADCPAADREPLSGNILAMSHQMRGLVESLLDLAKMDNADVKEAFRTVSFSEIVSESVMVFEPVFFEKDLPLRYEIEPNICVCGVPAQLNRLVGILLDNAGKYASVGGETVVTLRRIAHRRCLFEVANQGDPISAADRENIFRRFYRIDSARAMNHSYGLGLSIAREIAAAHRGTIRCESSSGYNRFIVELPCGE